VITTSMPAVMPEGSSAWARGTEVAERRGMLNKASPALVFLLLSVSCVAGFAARPMGPPVVYGPPPQPMAGEAPQEPASGPPVSNPAPAYPSAPASPAASGSPRFDGFAFDVKEYSGVRAAWVISKLTTFKVGPACLQRMSEKKERALHIASFYTRDIADYAQGVTGDDWSRVEAQDVGILGTMIDAFRSKLHVTIIVEGNDCKANDDALWMRYWYTVGATLKSYPPRSGRAFVTIEATTQVKDLTVSVDPGGTTFRIVGPRDLAADGWEEKLAKPFRKLAK
jgi:hypothetical protein